MAEKIFDTCSAKNGWNRSARQRGNRVPMKKYIILMLAAVMLFTFLTKVLGIPEERADEEACIMEHAISDDSFEKWTAYIKSLDLG